MSDRYIKSFFIAFFLYTIFIVGFLLAMKKIENNPKENTIFISLLSQNQPKESKSIQQFQKLEKVHKKEKTIVKAREVSNKTLEKSYTSKSKEQQNKAKNPTSVIKQTKTVKSQEQKPSMPENSRLDTFLTDVKNRINSNKHYPSLAKNEGIEGNIHATFTINSDGSVSNIVILEGNMLLRRATRKAIEKSFPIDIPDEIKNSMPINGAINLNFNLIK